MILIVGTRGREIESGSGTFHCPRCAVERTYIRRRVATYFTLFFIPLFKVRDLGEYVECTTCHQRFELAVLDYHPRKVSELHHLTSTAARDLEAGMPMQMVVRKLMNAGLHEDSAKGIAASSGGAPLRTCRDCGMVYHRAVRRCTNCGADLPEPPRFVAG
jgi:hypothetical protein